MLPSKEDYDHQITKGNIAIRRCVQICCHMNDNVTIQRWFWPPNYKLQYCDTTMCWKMLSYEWQYYHPKMILTTKLQTAILWYDDVLKDVVIWMTMLPSKEDYDHQITNCNIVIWRWAWNETSLNCYAESNDDTSCVSLTQYSQTTGHKHSSRDHEIWSVLCNSKRISAGKHRKGCTELTNY